MPPDMDGEAHGEVIATVKEDSLQETSEPEDDAVRHEETGISFRSINLDDYESSLTRKESYLSFDNVVRNL